MDRRRRSRRRARRISAAAPRAAPVPARCRPANRNASQSPNSIAAISTSRSLTPIPIVVVDIENVDARQAQALQAVLERAHDAVMRIVVEDVERQRVPALEPGRGLRNRAQQSTDLGRQYPLASWLIAQRIADG